jgi:hypothetical protein
MYKFVGQWETNYSNLKKSYEVTISNLAINLERIKKEKRKFIMSTDSIDLNNPNTTINPNNPIPSFFGLLENMLKRIEHIEQGAPQRTMIKEGRKLLEEFKEKIKREMRVE